MTADPKLKPSSDGVRDATHVKAKDGRILKIKEKWGISPEGHFAKASAGGFGCITENGERIDMWHASAYLKEVPALATVHIQLSLPQELLREYLQHNRDFEMKHFNQTEFMIGVDAPDMTVEQVETVMQSIRPPYPHQQSVKFGKA